MPTRDLDALLAPAPVLTWRRRAGTAVANVVGRAGDELRARELEFALEAVGRSGSSVESSQEVRLEDGTSWIVSRSEQEGEQHAMAIDATRLVAARRDHRRLQKRVAEAEKLDAVSRLAGGSAHDINNILTAIGGFADLLALQLADDPEAARDLAAIRGGVTQAAGLTRKLLSVAGRDPVRTRPLDVVAALRELELVLQGTLGEDLQLELVLPAGALVVSIDPMRFQQILLNLAMNARDAMPDGGRLEIEAATVALPFQGGPAGDIGRSAAEAVTITVRDYGPGIDPAIREQLFEPFVSTRATGRAAGLGLATTWSLVRQSGGWISIESAPGQGTEVEIGLPRLDYLDVDLPVNLDRTARPALIVAEPSLAREIGRELVALGLAPRFAWEPQHAFAAVREPLAVLVAHIDGLPGLPGLELLERLRLIRPRLPAVLLLPPGRSHQAGRDVAQAPADDLEQIVSQIAAMLAPQRL